MELDTWIYHRKEEPKLINHSELSKYLKEGWAETPAAFLSTHQEEPSHGKTNETTDAEEPIKKTRKRRQ